MRLLRVLVVAGIAAGGMLACSGDSPTNGDNNNPSASAGTYFLQTVDGQSLPAVLSQTSTDTTRVTGALLNLSGDGSYSESRNLRMTGDSGVTTVTFATGSWTQSGSTITFIQALPPPRTFTGSLSGNAITVIEAGLAWVYRK
jgi:hypothetical protein